MALISISSTYGAGGTLVADQVAARFGFQVVDRAIPARVADALAVPLQLALEQDEKLQGGVGGLLARSVVALAGVGTGTLPPEAFTDNRFKAGTERVLRELADAGGVVVLGRAGAFVLGHRPDALHVRLDGPAEARVRQAMRALGVSEDEARRSLRETDHARALYVRHFHSADWADPSAYELAIDSTAISLPMVVELVVAAARDRLGIQPVTSPSPG